MRKSTECYFEAGCLDYRLLHKACFISVPRLQDIVACSLNLDQVQHS